MKINIHQNSMSKPQKQTVYLPVKVEYGLKTVLMQEEGYFFSPEQFNEHNQNVIKQTLETAAEKVTVKESRSFTGVRTGSFYASKESITNTFEETYEKFKV